ncbi:MAG: ribose 5-phosphate isomerase B [Planctomycetes bacterium]|nr:ribose 5-phosphate isomerase B [Planctomycetota bacterium]
MKIAVGSDHAGFELKKALVEYLGSTCHHVEDMGTGSGESVDYPDFAAVVGKAVAGGSADRGVLVCGTGIGMAISANKIRGVRAANCTDEYSAEMSRRHNDANILTLGSRVVTPEIGVRILKVWLGTEFEGGRHAKRVRKITGLENQNRHPDG